MSKADVDNVKEIIDFFYPHMNCGIFNCKGVGNDSMSTVYDKDGVRVDVCYEYMYFEVFGLTEEEFFEVEEYYNSLEDSYSGAPGNEISVSNFNATKTTVGAHQVESKMTNFDVELQKVKVEELAYLRSRRTPCEDCPLVNECVKDEFSCFDLWVRYLKQESLWIL